MQRLRLLSLFLAVLMLCLATAPASAAESVESATASTMQLMKTEGTVNVTNSSNRSLTKRDNMRLYNGYHLETKAKSYAWINLDSEKLAKLDAVSKVELRKSGNLFFNIKEPLKEDETLNIRTSTMVVGIRGTSGWIRILDRWSSELYVLEGTVQLSVTDPVTGQIKTADIHGGEKAVAIAYPQSRVGDKCDILQDRYTAEDIDGFVLEELAQDPELYGDIYEATGSAWIPDGCAVKRESDGTYSLRRQSAAAAAAVQAEKPVVTDVLEALRGAKSDETVKLSGDATLEAQKYISISPGSAENPVSLDRERPGRRWWPTATAGPTEIMCRGHWMTTAH